MRRALASCALAVMVLGCQSTDDGAEDKDTDAAGETDGDDDGTDVDTEVDTDIDTNAVDACPATAAPHSVCSDTTLFGAFLFSIANARVAVVDAFTDNSASFYEGTSLQLNALGFQGDILAGTATCGVENIFVDYRHRIGAPDAKAWRADGTNGSCTITVDAAGNLSTDVITGSFEGTLVSGDSSELSITGIFQIN